MTKPYGNAGKPTIVNGRLAWLHGYGEFADIEYDEPAEPRRGTPARHPSNAAIDARMARVAQTPLILNHRAYDEASDVASLRKTNVGYW